MTSTTPNTSVARPAIFFDRDGVLNQDQGYVYKIKDWRWIDGAIKAIKNCNERNYFVFIVTNQSGIGRGFYSEQDVNKLHQFMQDDLQQYGAKIDDIRYCPHHQDAIITKYKIVITKSTVPVTTGDQIEKILNSLKKKNLVDVVSNPEFLREGEAIRDFIYPDRVVVGANDKKSANILKSLYSPLISKGAKFISTNRRAAELIKYAANAFLATKITFINEIANLCEKTDIDVEDISIGIGLDKRIGSRFLRAGPAYGGSCFPKDTKAIVTTADKFKTNLSVIKSVIKSNTLRSKLLLKKVDEILNNKIKNKKICFLGVTFKANTDDMRDSSSLEMMPFLSKKGAKIKYYDPTGLKKEFNKLKNVSFSNSIHDAVKGADLVILHTEWNDFKSINFKKLHPSKNLKIYDMRNIYSPLKVKSQGFKYFGIGR